LTWPAFVPMVGDTLTQEDSNMTRKHFVELARIVAELDAPKSVRFDLAISLSVLASNDNPHFDHAKFLHACGLGA